MREIKFRAWDEINKQFRYFGFDFNENSEHHDIFEILDWVMRWKWPITQYAGLKDKNGHEIYEGDILKHPQYCNFELTGSFINPVEWGETGDSDGYSHGKHFEWIVEEDSLADIYEKSEVIGNIHENPDLLTQNTNDEGRG